MDVMGELLASQTKKPLSLFRGQEVEGEIVSISNKELILDLGVKSEGALPARDIPKDKLDTLKAGDKLKAFVVLPENESGQVVLSAHLSSTSKTSRGRGSINWIKFIQAQNSQSKLNGKVLEINKGGLMVEIERVRGFLPNSQVGFEILSKLGEKIEDLLGQNLTVTVLEVDEGNNRLIFSQRGQVSDEILKKLKEFKTGQKVTGKIVAILPFGLVVDLDPSGDLGTGGVEGLVFISDVAWEKVEDLAAKYKTGQELKTQVLGIDEELGRVNLSIKHLTEDPFTKLSQKYPADEVVKGEITEVTSSGVAVKLEDGVEGFMPASKMDALESYQVGKFITVLVDSVDTQRRRVNLAPFVTTTKGLIYK